MKTHRQFIATTLILLIPLGQLRASEDDNFPKIGNTYQIAYSSQPEGYYWPYQVRVLKRGMGQWCLVEFDHVFNPPPRGKPTPKDWDYQKKIEERWINFGLLVQATDNDNTEPK